MAYQQFAIDQEYIRLHIAKPMVQSIQEGPSMMVIIVGMGL